MEKAPFYSHSMPSKPNGSGSDSWFSYICGHCSTTVSGAVLCYANIEQGCHLKWLNCPECGNPSAQDAEGNIHPGSLFGPTIQGLPDEVNSAYEEARKTMSVMLIHLVN